MAPKQRDSFQNGSNERLLQYSNKGGKRKREREREMTITFVPIADLQQTAKCLDNKRLSSSKSEAISIWNALRNETKLSKAGYCLMWKGYEQALVLYINAILVECQNRNHQLSLAKPFDGRFEMSEGDDVLMPPWWGDEMLHSCHRHALVAKESSHYTKFDWLEDGSDYTGSYIWPVPIDDDDDGGGDGGGNTCWIFRWPKASNKPSFPLQRNHVKPTYISVATIKKGLVVNGNIDDEVETSTDEKLTPSTFPRVVTPIKQEEKVEERHLKIPRKCSEMSMATVGGRKQTKSDRKRKMKTGAIDTPAIKSKNESTRRLRRSPRNLNKNV